MTRKRPRPTEPRAHRLGALGESLAAAHLAASGYRVVAQNLRTRFGEIDVLVRRRRLYVAVEVKTRSGHPAPEHLVDDDRVARLAHALRQLAPSLRPPPRDLRVDVIAIRAPRSGGSDLRHFEGAPFAP